MKNDDYGFYGKGLDGYVHYRQGMQEAARNAPNASGGRWPVSVEQKTTEPAPKSDESGAPVSDYARMLSLSWAKGEITGEQMKSALMSFHRKIASQVHQNG